MNFSQEEVEKRRERVIGVPAKRKYRRNQIMKYLRGLFIVLMIGYVFLRLYSFASHIPGEKWRVKEEELLAAGTGSEIYDGKGEKIQTIDTSGSTKEYVSIRKIPRAVKQAFIASEDKKFYKHSGVDTRGIIEDIRLGLFQKENIGNMQTTITQKLIKNQISGFDTDDSFFSAVKQIIREQYTAVALENDLTKNQILEYYLNTLSFGQEIIGVQAASRQFFGKDVSELTVSEAAVLVAAAKSPTTNNPVDNSDANGKERMIVLKNMLDEGNITEDEYEDALGDDVYLRIHNNEIVSEESTGQVNSYYVDAVLDQIMGDLQTRLGYSATEAYHTVYGEGLKIYTCQDTTIQKICNDVINDEKYYPKAKSDLNVSLSSEQNLSETQASIVLIEQETGEVQAIVGGKGDRQGNRSLNRAIQLERQPGTTFDVLSTYTPALDTANMTLGTVQDDAAYKYPETSVPVYDVGGNEFSGLLPMRDSIVFSKAIPTIKTLDKISVQVGYSYLRRFGLTTLVEKKRADQVNVAGGQQENKSDLQLKMGLGQLTDGVTNLEMTAAYAAFGDQGGYHVPKFYTKVVDRYGHVLLKNDRGRKQIMKKSTAWLLTDAMKGVSLQLETDLNKNAKGIAVAGKSGITLSNTDTWYIGFTPYYTAGIWAGRDEGESMDSAVYAASMWKDIMERVHRYKNIKKAEFKKPQDIVSRQICTKCGNLSIAGLCDEAEGGSTVRKEYFLKGTEPVKNCTCHAKYRFCKEGHALAGEKCPSGSCEERILLLKKETSETKDTKLTLEANSGGTVCRIHK